MFVFSLRPRVRSIKFAIIMIVIIGAIMGVLILWFDMEMVTKWTKENDE